MTVRAFRSHMGSATGPGSSNKIMTKNYMYHNREQSIKQFWRALILIQLNTVYGEGETCSPEKDRFKTEESCTRLLLKTEPKHLLLAITASILWDALLAENLQYSFFYHCFTANRKQPRWNKIKKTMSSTGKLSNISWQVLTTKKKNRLHSLNEKKKKTIN